MKKFTKNKGFTIVELIVVMAIIAILILIAVPTFTRYIQDAEDTSQLGTVNTIYKSTMAAVVDDFSNTTRAVIPASGEVNDAGDATDELLEAINDGVSGDQPIVVYGYTTADLPTRTDTTSEDWEVYIPSAGGVADVTEDIYVVAPDGTVYQNGIEFVEPPAGE